MSVFVRVLPLDVMKTVRTVRETYVFRKTDVQRDTPINYATDSIRVNAICLLIAVNTIRMIKKNKIVRLCRVYASLSLGIIRNKIAVNIS